MDEQGVFKYFRKNCPSFGGTMYCEFQTNKYRDCECKIENCPVFYWLKLLAPVEEMPRHGEAYYRTWNKTKAEKIIAKEKRERPIK